MQLSHYLILKLRVKIYNFLLCDFHCGMSYKQTADYDIVTLYDGLTGDLHKTRPLYKSDKMNARFTLLLILMSILHQHAPFLVLLKLSTTVSIYSFS